MGVPPRTYLIILIVFFRVLQGIGGGGLQPLPTIEHGGNVYLIEQEDGLDE